MSSAWAVVSGGVLCIITLLTAAFMLFWSELALGCAALRHLLVSLSRPLLLNNPHFSEACLSERLKCFFSSKCYGETKLGPLHA